MKMTHGNWVANQKADAWERAKRPRTYVYQLTCNACAHRFESGNTLAQCPKCGSQRGCNIGSYRVA